MPNKIPNILLIQKMSVNASDIFCVNITIGMFLLLGDL